MGDLITSKSRCVAQPTSLESALPCIRCGYDLRGLDGAGACPECSAPIGESLAAGCWTLGSASRSWLWRVAVGALLAGLAPALLEWCQLGTSGDLQLALRYPSYAGAFVLAGIGLWLVTAREPGGPYFDEPRRLRCCIRALCVPVTLSGVAVYLLEMECYRGSRILDIDPATLQRWALGISFIGGILLIMLLLPAYLTGVARRQPGNRLLLLGRLSMLNAPGMFATIAAIQYCPGLTATSFAVLQWLLYALGAWPSAFTAIWTSRILIITRQHEGRRA